MNLDNVWKEDPIVTKHILVLHTGGTISMTETRDGDIMPSQHNPLLGADSFVPAGVELTNEEIFNLPWTDADLG